MSQQHAPPETTAEPELTQTDARHDHPKSHKEKKHKHKDKDKDRDRHRHKDKQRDREDDGSRHRKRSRSSADPPDAVPFRSAAADVEDGEIVDEEGPAAGRR
jgi:hypothetical protein